MNRNSAFLSISVVLLSSCGSEPERHVLPAPAPVTITVAAVAAQEWPVTYEATGTVRARTTATVASKVMGYVREVNAQVGEHVRESQALVVLEARDLDANVRRAEAGRAEVESARPELENATAAAKANLDLAQSTFQRMQELAAKKSISNQEFDEASARLKAAQASYDMTRSRRAQLDSRMATVEQEIRAARIQREYATLTAPFSGVVISRTVEPGNLAAPGAPLLTIERDGLYRLEASVEESKLASVRTGQAVEAVLDGDRKLSARVSEIVPSVDPASRTYLVKLDLPAVEALRSGMFGRAIFAMGTEKVVSVPPAALLERGQLQSVCVVEDGMAHTRLVTTGRRAGAAVEILSGLGAGEKIAVPFPAGLRDGARVEVRP